MRVFVLLQDELTSTSSSAPSPTDDSDHKPLPTPPYCNEDIKPQLNADATVVTTESDANVTDPCSGSTVATVAQGSMQERALVTTVTPVADVFIKTEVKTEPVDYDWPTTDVTVTSHLLAFRGGDATETDNVGCGASQGPAVTQRAVHDESLPLQQGQGPSRLSLKPSSQRMSPLPFACRNSPATSQRGSPVTLQRASPVCSRRASPALVACTSPDLVMHRPSPGPMNRGSPPLMHRVSPVSQRRGSPLAFHHGFPHMAPHLIGQSSRTGFAPFPGSRTLYQQQQLSGAKYPPEAVVQRLPQEQSQGLQGPSQGHQGSSQGVQGPLQGIQGPSQGLQGPSQGLQGPLQGLHGPSQGLQGPSQGPRPLQGPSQGPPPLVSSATTQPPKLLDIRCKQEPPETPPPLVPGSPHMRHGSPHMQQGSPHMRSRTPPVITPVRPQSPNVPRQRSRSRSPVRDTGSPISDTAAAPRSPSPPARIVNEECYRSKSAM